MIIDKIDLSRDHRIKTELLDEIQKMYGYMIHKKGLPVARQNVDQVAYDLLWKSVALFCDPQADEPTDINNLPEVKNKIYSITLDAACNITRLLKEKGLRHDQFGDESD